MLKLAEQAAVNTFTDPAAVPLIFMFRARMFAWFKNGVIEFGPTHSDMERPRDSCIWGYDKDDRECVGIIEAMSMTCGF